MHQGKRMKWGGHIGTGGGVRDEIAGCHAGGGWQGIAEELGASKKRTQNESAGTWPGGRSREGQEECRGSPKQRTHCAAPREGLVARRTGRTGGPGTEWVAETSHSST